MENKVKESKAARMGYCRVKPGDILGGKYKAVKKLGHGRFSNCWEVRKEETGADYALKIQRCKKEYAEFAEDEIKVLESMKSDDESWSENVVKLYEWFDHKTKYGRHVCMVFDKMDLNVWELLEKYQYGMPIPLVKEIAKQGLNGLGFLRKHNIIHTDIKPENVLIKVQDSSVTVKICDLGSGCWTDHHFTDNIGTTEYRSLETIINAEYDCATDIWSFACMIYELLTGDYLFDPHSYIDEIEFGGISSRSDSEQGEDSSDSEEDETCDSKQKDQCKESTDEVSDDSDYSETDSDDDDDNYLVDQMHLWLMTSILGNVPKYIQRRGELSSDFFHRAGNIRKKPSYIKGTSISKKLRKEYNFSKEEADGIEEFLLPMLRYDPEKRATPEEMLKHKWLAQKIE